MAMSEGAERLARKAAARRGDYEITGDVLMRWEIEYLEWRGDELVKVTAEMWVFSFGEIREWVRAFGIWPVLGVRRK
jgi:hypothetical protein